uniref:Uncharacterized protein n=1 Tax=Avena sativa TaxID=4498 RepID=A0ACD5YC19_AVESA
MPRAGAPESRPTEDAITIEETPAMRREVVLLGSNCAVAWIDWLVQGVPNDEVQEAVAVACNALPNDVCVVTHHPEQYLITFIFDYHCDTAIKRSVIPVGRYSLQVLHWRLEAHADHVNMDYHVRVGLDNVQLHGWNLHTVARIIGKAASLDYIEARLVRKESTNLLWAWAWTENPSHIPKVAWVTLPARAPPAGARVPRGRRGLRHKVLVHLVRVEDFTTKDANGNPPPPYELPYRIGEVDGESVARRRAASPRRHDDRRDRRDDDRGGRDRSRGWREALRRSLSRNHRAEQGRDDRGARHRRYDSKDGHRRHDAHVAVLEDADAASATLTGVKAVQAQQAGVVLLCDNGSTSSKVVVDIDGAERHPSASLDVRTSAELALAARRSKAMVNGSLQLGGLADASGRSRSHHPSSVSVRRQARASLTPPASPTSPVSVFPSPHAARKFCSPVLQEIGPLAQSIYSPSSLLRPLQLSFPSKPPGFASPELQLTPAFVPSNPRARTPGSEVSVNDVAAAEATGLDKLFMATATPLLQAPLVSPPPRRPTARRLTLAIHRSGFTCRRSSGRIRALRKAKPMAKEAEAFVCRNLSIIKDGKIVTDQALEEFVRMFKDQASVEAVHALRAMFKLDDASCSEVEWAMMAREGAAALEQFETV